VGLRFIIPSIYGSVKIWKKRHEKNIRELFGFGVGRPRRFADNVYQRFTVRRIRVLYYLARSAKVAERAIYFTLRFFLFFIYLF